jgi:hypothetical protein
MDPNSKDGMQFVELVDEWEAFTVKFIVFFPEERRFN